MKKILILAFAIKLNLVFCSSAFPCVYANYWWKTNPPCQRFNNSNLVALGTVTKVDIVKDVVPKGGEFQVIRFAIQESFKGTTKKVIYLRDSYGSDCDYSYKVGDKFLVFSSSAENGSNTYDINVDTTSKEDDDFAKDIEYCRVAKKGLAGATISGVVVKSNRETTNDRINYDGMSKVNVLIQNSKSSYKLKTDEEGKFGLSGLKTGTYKITVDLYDWFGKPMSDEISLGENGCEEISGSTTEQSSITGMLLNPKDEIASEVELQLIALDPITNQPTEDSLSELTDENGQFRFANIPEGRYLLAHNYADENYDDKKKYPTSFFPGTRDIISASFIEIKNRQSLNLGVYKLIAETE